MIPFYQSKEWSTCPRVPVVLNGQLCFAYDTTAKGETWQPKRGHAQRIGLLDNVYHEFMLTHNYGRGETDRHYLYFQQDGKLFFVYTGECWPDTICIETAV
ncbi:hypothetical protein ACUXAV_001638 [Cupriavidus metallidurans]|jgi:hypothetical protein|uniref:hypothetical protein n=1 Tax=Cupriavidus metallidurans TaxID=119219 RepID=UPI00049360A5|nr:hypothetical protein [Cupriavidus metallidurans]MDE4917018.1 hypothetical protein [Cupriavidus metallidurans]